MVAIGWGTLVMTCHRGARRYGVPMALVAAGACLWQAGVGIPGVPRLVDLGSLVGGQQAKAMAVNDAGQVAGMARTGTGGWHAFLWEKRRMRDLGTLGGGESCALALNNRGQVVGWAHTKTGAMHAFLWESGRMRDLVTLPRLPDSTACAINDHGEVVGYAFGKLGRRALLWRKGQLAELNDLSRSARGWVLECAAGINDDGWVVGEAWRPALKAPIAYRWAGGSIQSVGYSDRRCTSAHAINANGDIAVSHWGTGRRSLLWSQGKLGLLGERPPQDTMVTVGALNNRGVAAACESPRQVLAFRARQAVLLRAGRTVYLDPIRRSGPRMRLTAANGINNRGDIVGCGYIGGKWRAFLLTGVAGADGR